MRPSYPLREKPSSASLSLAIISSTQTISSAATRDLVVRANRASSLPQHTMTGLCLGSGSGKEAPDEYDRIPRSLRWRLKFAKKDDRGDANGAEVLKLGNNRVVKRGCESTEYEALRVVDRHTEVPIPKVQGVYQMREGVLVEYEIMPGRPLDQVWPGLGQPQRRKIVDDLGRFVDQLRKMEPPKHMLIGSATMGAAFDRRFGRGRIGPFYSLDSFHDYIRRGHPLDDFPEQELKSCHDGHIPYKLKFTHAHLCPQNVLVDDSGRVASIIGWESAGWYPEYWEYTQMHNSTPKEMADWLEAVKNVVPRYDQELAADQVLRKRFTRSVYDEVRSVRAPSPSASELERERQEIDDKNTESTSG